LAAEVAHVCVNGIEYFRHRSHGDDLPQLRAIGALLFPSISTAQGFVSLLQELFSRAIGKLELEQERQAAHYSFGMMGTDSYNKKLKPRQQRAASEYARVTGAPLGVYRYSQAPEYERTIIINVGRAIERLAVEYNPQELAPLAPHRQYGTTYVPRDDLHWQLMSYLRQQPRVIALLGPAGSGKTRLADYYTQAGERIWLDATDDETLAFSTKQELMRYGFTAFAPDKPEASQRFAHLLGSARAPRFLVLDNLSDARVIAELSEIATSTVFIVTARRELDGVVAMKRVVVSHMTEAEARQDGQLAAADCQ
jgi:hypothetical protein